MKDSQDSSRILVSRPLLSEGIYLIFSQELMSETLSSQLYTQERRSDHSISFDSSGRPIMPQGLSQAKQEATQKPRFAEFTCSYNEVYCFAVLITKTVIPMQFWGSKWNFNLIKDREFLSFTLVETLGLHLMAQTSRLSFRCGGMSL